MPISSNSAILPKQTLSEHLRVDGVVVEVDEAPFLPDLLHGGLGTQGSHAYRQRSAPGQRPRRASCSSCGYEESQACRSSRNTDVDLTIEAAESSESRVDGGGGHDNV